MLALKIENELVIKQNEFKNKELLNEFLSAFPDAREVRRKENSSRVLPISSKDILDGLAVFKERLKAEGGWYMRYNLSASRQDGFSTSPLASAYLVTDTSIRSNVHSDNETARNKYEAKNFKELVIFALDEENWTRPIKANATSVFTMIELTPKSINSEKAIITLSVSAFFNRRADMFYTEKMAYHTELEFTRSAPKFDIPKWIMRPIPKRFSGILTCAILNEADLLVSEMEDILLEKTKEGIAFIDFLPEDTAERDKYMYPLIDAPFVEFAPRCDVDGNELDISDFNEESRAFSRGNGMSARALRSIGNELGVDLIKQARKEKIKEAKAGKKDSQAPKEKTEKKEKSHIIQEEYSVLFCRQIEGSVGESEPEVFNAFVPRAKNELIKSFAALSCEICKTEEGSNLFVSTLNKVAKGEVKVRLERLIKENGEVVDIRKRKKSIEEVVAESEPIPQEKELPPETVEFDGDLDASSDDGMPVTETAPTELPPIPTN